MSRPREIELKLELTPSEAEGLRGRGFAAAGAAEGIRERLRSVYYDTQAHALRERRLTLRVRQVGGRRIQTIKETDGVASGLFDRAEWETEIDGADPDLHAARHTPLEKVLRRQGAAAGLKAVFETVIDRTTWRIEANGAAIEVALDEGEVVADGASRPIAELELELKRGSPADLFAFARGLGTAASPRIAVLSKSERGYGLVERDGATAFKSQPIALARGTSTADAFRAVARACLRQFRLNEPHLIATGSVEALHQARVALRRLRSAMSIFREVIADGDVEGITARLKEMTGPFGEARNLDVYLARAVRPDAERDDPSPGIAEFAARLETDRAGAYERTIKALESAEFRALMLDILAWIEAGPWLTRDDPLDLRARPVEAFAADALDALRRKVKRRGRRLDQLDPAARHRVRIHAKKLRYGAEFFSGLVEGRKDRQRLKLFLSALEDLQGRLGELNDIEAGHVIAVEVARRAESAGTAGSDLHLFAAGRVSEAQDERTSRLLDEAATAHRALADAKPFWRG